MGASSLETDTILETRIRNARWLEEEQPAKQKGDQETLSGFMAQVRQSEPSDSRLPVTHPEPNIKSLAIRLGHRSFEEQCPAMNKRRCMAPKGHHLHAGFQGPALSRDDT